MSSVSRYHTSEPFVRAALDLREKTSFKSKMTNLKEKVSSAARPAFIALSLSMVKAARWTESAVRGFAKKSHSFHFFRHTQVLAGASAILHIRNIAVTIIASRKVAAKEKLENTVKVISSVGSLADSTAGFISFLSASKLIKTFSWMPPLLAVSFVVESAAVGLHIRGFSQSKKFSNDFRIASGIDKKTEDFSIDDYRKGLKFIQDEQALAKEKKLTSQTKKYIEGNEIKLNEALTQIEKRAEEKLKIADDLMNSKDEAHIALGKQLKNEANDKLKRTMKALNRKITAKKWSHVLSIIATVVAGIGLGILLFTPLAPLGFTLLTVSVLTGIVDQLVYQRRVNKAFKRTIQEAS